MRDYFMNFSMNDTKIFQKKGMNVRFMDLLGFDKVITIPDPSSVGEIRGILAEHYYMEKVELYHMGEMLADDTVCNGQTVTAIGHNVINGVLLLRADNDQVVHMDIWLHAARNDDCPRVSEYGGTGILCDLTP